MLLTMEADCIKEELYRYFGRTTHAPSKAAFYRQRRKLTSDALANLLFTFNFLMTSEFFIKCLLDQVNVEQLVPNQLAFLMKSKKPHILGGLSSLL